MCIQSAGFTGKFFFPDQFIEASALKRYIFIADQLDQQIKFLDGQFHRFPILSDFTGLQINGNAVQFQSFFTFSEASQHSLHPGQQFSDLKRLYNIIVGSQLQSFDPVIQAGSGCDKNDGNTGGTYILHQLVTVDSGQHDIQQDQIIVVFLDQFGCMMPVEGTGAGVSLVLQVYADQVVNGRFIFNNQYIHGSTLP